MSGSAGLVEAVARGGEDGGMVEPELECLGGEVWGEMGDEQVTESSVFALAKDLPEVVVGESGEGSDLELEKVVLVGVEVDGVDAAGGVGSAEVV